MTHPFKVGYRYRNREKEYEVVSLDPPWMKIRFGNGAPQTASIAMMVDIWEDVRTGAVGGRKAKPARKGKGKSKGTSKRKAPSKAIGGLVDHDFQGGVTGTRWRRRTELGGLLAGLLSDKVPYEIASNPSYRRAQVLYGVPGRSEANKWHPVAKFEIRLSESGALYGFYIEKSSEPMTDGWDWSRTLAALAESDELWRGVEESMRRLALSWEMTLDNDPSVLFKPDPEHGERLQVTRPSSDAPQSETISWPEFLGELSSIPPDVWCDLRLCAHMDKAAVLGMGVNFSTAVVEVYEALIPLYEASVPAEFSGRR